MWKSKWWLNSEYVDYTVDWSKVAVDTPILVSDNQDFENMEEGIFANIRMEKYMHLKLVWHRGQQMYLVVGNTQN